MEEKRSTRLLAALLVICIGVMLIAFTPLNNGVLTQIRTGTNILHSGHVAHSDPYSFTAYGHAWTDQSWLIEVTYGIANNIFGFRGVVMENILAGLLTVLVLIRLCWNLTILRMVIAATVPAAFLALQWGQRPIAFALLFFALEVLIFERKRSPWWLLPLGWLWVNSHGSFIFGLAWALAFAIGEYCDERSVIKPTLKRVAALLAGCLLGALSPAGPSVLWFWTVPFGSRSQAFDLSPDWAAPDFLSTSGAILGVTFFGTLIFAAVKGKQWRHRIPVVGLAIAVLISYRHMPFFAVALCPLLALAMSNVNISERVAKAFSSAVLPGMLAGAAFLFVAVIGTRVTSPTNEFVQNYPVDAIVWMHDQGLLTRDHRVGGREVVGNVIEWKYGTDTRVFFDDRFDMYPAEVSLDSARLTLAKGDPAALLDKYGFDLYVSHEGGPLANYLNSSPNWHQICSKNGWLVFQRS